MAIQHRRGIYSRFDPARLVAGEWAIVLSGDTSASDGMAAYICFAAGKVKRVATFEDMAENIAAANEQLIQQLTTELTTNLNTAATRANDAADRCGGGEDARVAAEATRVSNEDARVSAESTRVSHEKVRVSAEQTRVSNESGRVSAESTRASAEQTRIDNEEARGAAELLRASAETARIDNETARTTAEATRIDNESGRVTAEKSRAESESGRVNAEAKRKADFAAIEQKIATRFRHMCRDGEYDAGTRKPLVEAPDPLTRYFVPTEHPTEEDQWVEWEWDVEGARWEKIGTSQATFSPVSTGQIDAIAGGASVTGNEVVNASGLSYAFSLLRSLFSPVTHRHSLSEFSGGEINGSLSVGGSLTVSGTGTFSAPAIDRDGAPPQSDQWVNALRVNDSDGEMAAAFPVVRRVNKRMDAGVIVYNEGSAQVSNYILAGVMPNGTRTYDVADAAAFRSAIGTHNASNITTGMLAQTMGGTGRAQRTPNRKYWCGRVLYDNSSGTNGSITLSEDAGRFDFLLIGFRENDGFYDATFVASPNGKVVVLTTSESTVNGATNTKWQTRTISGRSMAVLHYAEFSTEVNQIRITHVIGFS